MEWVETTAKTVDEAKELALDQLGVDEADAEFEVLEEPRPGLFGRTRGEARVRARVRPTRPRPKMERRDRRRKGEGGTGVATDRLGNDLVCRERWKRLAHERRLRRDGEHVDVFIRDEREESIDGAGEQRLPADQWNERLRSLWAAERPETGAAAPCQDHRIRSRAHRPLHIRGIVEGERGCG